MRLNIRFMTIAMALLITFSGEIFAQQSAPTGNQSGIEPLLRAIEAQGRTQEALLRTLIEEMRQSRLTTQLNSVNLYRLQVLSDSLGNQQTRVDNLATELEQLTEYINQAGDTSRLEADLRDMETSISETVDPAQRTILEQSFKATKRSMETERERNLKGIETNRTRQQELQVRLQTEKARLAEMEEKIAAMDRHFQNVTAEITKKK